MPRKKKIVEPEPIIEEEEAPDISEVELRRYDNYNFALMRKIKPKDPTMEAGWAPFAWFGNLKHAALAALQYLTIGNTAEEILQALARSEAKVLKAVAEFEKTKVSAVPIIEEDEQPEERINRDRTAAKDSRPALRRRSS